jgi:hypothetical protein
VRVMPPERIARIAEALADVVRQQRARAMMRREALETLDWFGLGPGEAALVVEYALNHDLLIEDDEVLRSAGSMLRRTGS